MSDEQQKPGLIFGITDKEAEHVDNAVQDLFRKYAIHDPVNNIVRINSKAIVEGIMAIFKEEKMRYAAMFCLGLFKGLLERGEPI